MLFRIVGYTPFWHLKPGVHVSVHVSTELDRYWTRLIRFLGAITETEDWTKRTTSIPSSAAGPFEGKRHPIVRGSHVTVRHLHYSGPVTISVGVWLREPPTIESTVLHTEFAHEDIDLLADTDGALIVGSRDDSGFLALSSTGLSLGSKQWYEVGMAVDCDAGTIAVSVRSRASGDTTQTKVLHDCSTSSELLSISVGGIRGDNLDGADALLQGNLDGKVEHLRLWSPTADALRDIVREAAGQPVGHWDFSALPYRDEIKDLRGRFPDAIITNAPTRAVTSSEWCGQVTDFTKSPELYAAVFLHRDDLSDARWPAAFELTVPDDTPSGAYCLILSEQPDPNYADPTSFYPIPLFVAPSAGRASEIALVLPTFSYRSYANNTLYEDADPGLYELKGPTRSAIVYDYCVEEQLRSLYCSHPDNSGVHIASLLRPQASVRPDLVSQLHSFTHQLSADLEIIQWLETLEASYDVLTDEQLHLEGSAALRPYRIALTGSHPEYSTNALLDAYAGYLDGGGNLLYLGGNGFTLRVAIDAAKPWLQELRRGDAGAIWDDAPGESRHQVDGELGGLWRRIGRPPNLLTGLGYSAIGFSGDGTYVAPARPDLAKLPSRLRDVIARLGDAAFGVAGLELDCYDTLLGSNPDAVIFGQLNEVPAGYTPTGEYLAPLMPDPTAAINSSLRSHLIYQRNRGGGHTASFGSIRWASALNKPGDPARVNAITTAALLDFLER